VTALTNFDEKHCHKWALLLCERQAKLNQSLTAIANNDFKKAKRLFNEVFRGVAGGKNADPGMSGSLLYHMAMVTKMETETNILLEEMHVTMPDITEQLVRFYSDFASDVYELAKPIFSLLRSGWKGLQLFAGGETCSGKPSVLMTSASQNLVDFLKEGQVARFYEESSTEESPEESSEESQD